MAFKKLYTGYGQIELNNVAFRRDGRIEAQCQLDATDFAKIPAENGMLLAVDKVKKTIKFAKDNTLPVAINYTAEHMYDERDVGALAKFALPTGTFLPRMGYLSVGDLFTTNCIGAEETTFADTKAVEAAIATGVYGKPSAQGVIELVNTAPTDGIVLRAVKATTMPDGKFALKFQVYKA
jgi:hypothetical protein